MSIVAIAGSPSRNARSNALLHHALDLFPATVPRATIAVRDLPSQALLHARHDDPILQQACRQVADASLVLIATPIYKAAYSGLLKTFLDLLPQDGLRGKTVLAIGTGGSTAHLLALDYALRPVLCALGARQVLDAVYAVDATFGLDTSGRHVPADDILDRLENALADAPYPMALRSPRLAIAA